MNTLKEEIDIHNQSQPMQCLVYGSYSSHVLADSTEVFDNGNILVLVPKSHVLRTKDEINAIRDRIVKESLEDLHRRCDKLEKEQEKQ
jgi:hypothetical protein